MNQSVGSLVTQLTPDLAVLFAVGILAAGVLAARQRHRSWPWHWLALALAVPVIVMVGLRGSVWTIDHLFWVDLALGPVVGCLLVAVAGGRPAPLVGVLESRPLRSLGSFSYSLYLTHAPIVIAVYYGLVAGRVPPGVPTFLVLVAVVVPVTIVFARLFAAAFELPFQRHRGWPALARAGSGCYRWCRSLTRSPRTTRTRPTSAISGPSTAHTVLPLIALPPITPMPCSPNVTPASTSSPPTITSPLRIAPPGAGAARRSRRLSHPNVWAGGGVHRAGDVAPPATSRGPPGPVTWHYAGNTPSKWARMSDGEQVGLFGRGEVPAAREHRPAADVVETLEQLARRLALRHELVREDRHRGGVQHPVVRADRLCVPAVVEVVPHRRGDRPGHPVQRDRGEQGVPADVGVEVAVAVTPRSPLLHEPRGQPDRGVGQPVPQGLRPRRLDGAVAPLGLVPTGDVVEVRPLGRRERCRAGPQVRTHLGCAQVDAHHARRLRQRHVRRHSGAEVAAVRAVALVPQPLHEPVPQPRDVDPVHSDLRRTRREGVARQRWHDEVEVVRKTVDEREHLGEGAGPPVREDQGRLARALVHEVHRDPVDLGHEVVVLVEPALLPAPVEPVCPVVGQVAQVAQIRSLAPRRPGSRFRPPRGAQPRPQVVENWLRHVDLVRLDTQLHATNLPASVHQAGRHDDVTTDSPTTSPPGPGGTGDGTIVGMSGSASSGEPVQEPLDRRLALLLAMAMFVLVVDTSLMNVSISAVVHDLDTTVSGVQSAIALEALVSAAFILIGSKVGDLIGRKRPTSWACSATPSAPWP